MKNYLFLKEQILKNTITKRKTIFLQNQNKSSDYPRIPSCKLPYFQGSLYLKTYKACQKLQTSSNWETQFLKNQFKILYNCSEDGYTHIKRYQKRKKKKRTLYSKILKAFHQYQKTNYKNHNTLKNLISHLKGEIYNDTLCHHSILEIQKKLKIWHSENCQIIISALLEILKERQSNENL